MNEGKTYNYHWIEGNEFGLHSLVTKCPQLIIGKNVVITSFDSGPLSPNDEEKGLGWYSKDDVFYAPKITNPKKLPYDQYDEWYIFDKLKEFKPIDAFVNYGSFFLRDPDYQLNEMDPTWDKVAIQHQINYQKEMQEKLDRQQLESTQAIIDPRDTRPFLIKSLKVLANREQKLPPRKHENIRL